MTLGPAEADRYRAALEGEIQTAPSIAPVDSADPSGPNPGCEAVARLAVRDRQPANNPLYANIFNDYYSQLKSDPRMIAATDEWAACVESESGLLATTDAPIALTRSNFALIREVDVFMRQGRDIRWLSLAEADQLDTSELPQPVDLKVDGETEIGYVASGPPTVTDADSTAALAARVNMLSAIEQPCWNATEGPAAIAALQQLAMERVAGINAAAD